LSLLGQKYAFINYHSAAEPILALFMISGCDPELKKDEFSRFFDRF
jgi:hypothetical protein